MKGGKNSLAAPDLGSGKGDLFILLGEVSDDPQGLGNS
jgi:hypothetical protein